MAIHYCPHCAKKITYEALKPKTCPACEKNIAAAFKPALPVVPAKTATVVMTEAAQPSSSLTRLQEQRKARAAVVVKQRTTRARQYYDADGNPVDMSEVDRSEVSDDSIDRMEKERLKNELIASIDPSKVLICADEDEKPVTFESWCMQPPAR